jgi:hypothetical protein
MGVLSVGQCTVFLVRSSRGVTWTFPRSGISQVLGNSDRMEVSGLPRLV